MRLRFNAGKGKGKRRILTAVRISVHKLVVDDGDGGDTQDTMGFLRRRRRGRTMGRRTRDGVLGVCVVVAVWVWDGDGMVVRMGWLLMGWLNMSGCRGGCVHDTAGLTSIAHLVGENRPSLRE